MIAAAAGASLLLHQARHGLQEILLVLVLRHRIIRRAVVQRQLRHGQGNFGSAPLALQVRPHHAFHARHRSLHWIAAASWALLLNDDPCKKRRVWSVDNGWFCNGEIKSSVGRSTALSCLKLKPPASDD